MTPMTKGARTPCAEEGQDPNPTALGHAPQHHCNSLQTDCAGHAGQTAETPTLANASRIPTSRAVRPLWRSHTTNLDADGLHNGHCRHAAGHNLQEGNAAARSRTTALAPIPVLCVRVNRWHSAPNTSALHLTSFARVATHMGHEGCIRREDGGWGGSGTQKFVYQK